MKPCRNIAMPKPLMFVFLLGLITATSAVTAASVSVVSANSLTTMAPPTTAPPNDAPLFESLPYSTEIAVGERLNLQVIPRDSDFTVPLLDARKLPTGSVLTDNRDGSRSLLWKPEARQIGVHHVVFTARDARDPSLRRERVLVLNVVSAPEQ